MGYTRLHLHFSDINATGTHACNQPTPVRLSLCEINVTAVLVASRITPITHRPPREDLHTRLGGLNTQHENIRFVAPDCTSEFNTRVLRALPTLEQAILLAYNVRTRRRRPTPVLCANATACPRITQKYRTQILLSKLEDRRSISQTDALRSLHEPRTGRVPRCLTHANSTQWHGHTHRRRRLGGRVLS